MRKKTNFIDYIILIQTNIFIHRKETELDQFLFFLANSDLTIGS